MNPFQNAPESLTELTREVTLALPSVAAIVGTRSRPQLLARAVRSIMAQDYAGQLDCVVVLDQCTDDNLDFGELPAGRTVTVISNDRTPGLMGARNSGVLATTADLIAFCDDDDEWLPTKISRQVELWAAHPEAIACATGMQVQTHESVVPRIPPTVVEQADLLRSRIQEIHPSTLVYRRADLLGIVGLVDEDLPGGYGEDYELLLRATRSGPVISVTESLAVIHWDRPSFFTGKWELVAIGLTYLLDVVPEFSQDRRGKARMQGQIAFAHAAVGRRRESLRWVGKTLVTFPVEPRIVVALVVNLRIVSAAKVLAWLHRRGRGV